MKRITEYFLSSTYASSIGNPYFSALEDVRKQRDVFLEKYKNHIDEIIEEKIDFSPVAPSGYSGYHLTAIISLTYYSKNQGV